VVRPQVQGTARARAIDGIWVELGDVMASAEGERLGSTHVRWSCVSQSTFRWTCRLGPVSESGLKTLEATGGASPSSANRRNVMLRPADTTTGRSPRMADDVKLPPRRDLE
jgi:hypothetical protein